MVTRAQIKTEPGVFIYSDLGPNDPRLINLYHICDLFVLPTFGDCLGLALLEAAAAGLPVITTRVGAIPEIVMPGETGILIPPGDLAALTAALTHLVEDSALRLRMGIQALELARQEFDGRQTTLQLLTLLRAVADTERGVNHG
jgi:glycosyltransferase involved in cell wall biosynthesis